MTIPPSSLEVLATTAATAPTVTRYAASRKILVILACALMASSAVFQTNILDQSLSFYSTEDKGQGNKFELRTTDVWHMNLDGEEKLQSIFNGDAHASRRRPSQHDYVFATTTTSDSVTTDDIPSRVEIDGNWEWHFHSIKNNSDTNKRSSFRGLKNAKAKLLIAQFADPKSAGLLEMTKPVNIAYAERWHHDYVALNSISTDQNVVNPSTLLAKAWEKRAVYEAVLILEPHAFIDKFGKDITSLLEPLDLVRAQRAPGAAHEHTYNVTAAVTLWNLRHLLIPTVQNSWNNQWKELQHPKLSASSSILSKALIPVREEVRTLKQEFSFLNDAWVRFLDVNVSQNRLKKYVHRNCKRNQLDCQPKVYNPADYPPTNNTSIVTHRQDTEEQSTSLMNHKTPPTSNLPKIEPAASKSASQDVAQTPSKSVSQDDEKSIDKVTSMTESESTTAVVETRSSNDNVAPTCEPRQEPVWEWRKYSREPQTSHIPKKRMLIAQYSSFGDYAKLLELTAPLNKAYAKRWNHDYVTLQGSALMLDMDEGCEPPPRRANFNKQELLRKALKKNDKYDLLLLLDADAMISDLDFDISTLSGDNDVLTAHRVSRTNSEPRTWNVNIGIVLWNLQHPRTKTVSQEWSAQCTAGLSAGSKHGDQHYLQAILAVKKRHQYVNGLPEEFFYSRGTVIKHFIRTKSKGKDGWTAADTKLEARETSIAKVVQEVCDKFPDDCESLEHSTFAR